MELTSGHSSGMSKMQSGALNRANSVALSSGGFNWTSKSDSDFESAGNARAAPGAGQEKRALGVPGGQVTSPLAFTQEDVEASGSALARTGRSSSCSVGSDSSGSSGSRNSTGGSGSLEVWMRRPKSPRAAPLGGASKLAAILSPAQESEEIDSAGRNSTFESTSDDDDSSDYDPGMFAVFLYCSAGASASIAVFAAGVVAVSACVAVSVSEFVSVSVDVSEFVSVFVFVCLSQRMSATTGLISRKTPTRAIVLV